MKTLMTNPARPNTFTVTVPAGYRPSPSYSPGIIYPNRPKQPVSAYPAVDSLLRHRSVLTAEARTEIGRGNIPDLSRVCQDLFDTFLSTDTPFSATQCIPVLKVLENFSQAEMRRFMKNPVTRHVLVQNDVLKVVLIHWKPGEFSGIHGHPQGGCVFKVLKGKVEEKRYSPDAAQRLLAVSTFQSGSMAYIDDDMAYHAVGNPFGASAISLHVYTPGKKQ